MTLDELNQQFENLNNAIQKANLEDFYLYVLREAPDIILPGGTMTTTDENGKVIRQEKIDDTVIDTAGEIRGLIGHLEEAMTLLKEYKQQAEKLEHTIDGLIEYAENEAAVGQYDNIIGAKAIGHAIETKFLYGYIPQDRFKQFEKRLSKIRHLSTFACDTHRNNLSVDSPKPINLQQTNTGVCTSVGISQIQHEDEELDCEITEAQKSIVETYFLYTSQYFKEQLQNAIIYCGSTKKRYAFLEMALEKAGRVKGSADHLPFVRALEAWGLIDDYNNYYSSVKSEYVSDVKHLRAKDKQVYDRIMEFFKDNI